MAKVLKSTHPTKRYANGGPVKKFANGDEVPPAQKKPVVVVKPPVVIPEGSKFDVKAQGALEGAGETLAAAQRRISGGLRGVTSMFKSPEAKAAERAAADAALKKKHTQ